MLERVLCFCALGVACGAMTLQAQDVFVLPGPGAASGQVAVFATGQLSQITSFNAGNGSFLVLPNATATKFYVIADSITQPVTSTDPTFSNPLAIGTFSAPATAAVVTPDGNVLAVAANTLHVFNTTTDVELVSGGLSQGNGINTFDVASSLDASTLFALGSSNTGASQLTAFSTSTLSVSGTLALPSGATAVAVGPNGLVYVSLPSEIIEVDPSTLQPTANGRMGVAGTPGPLAFTPDGLSAVAINQSSLVGSTLIFVTLANHTTSSPNLGVNSITSLFPFGFSSLLAFGTQGLYEVTTSSPVSSTPLQISGIPNLIQALAVSNEVASSAGKTIRYIFAVANNQLYEANPINESIVTQYPLRNVSAGALSFVAPALTTTQSLPITLLAYGTNQSIAPSTQSQPLVVQVLDENNHPIMGVPVKFQSNSSSATLSASTATTGTGGYALTYLTAPSTTGTITVTATVASLTSTATFNINVTNSTGGTAPQLTIVAGQGQLMLTNTSTQLGSDYGSPLEVLVSDSDGNPISGVPVTFSVPANSGTILSGNNSGNTATVNTGSNGIAEVNFLTTNLPTNNISGFAQATITASAPNANPVSFYLTTVTESPGATVIVRAPGTGALLTGPEGGTLSGAVSVQVFSSDGLGIPNISLTLNDGNLDPSIYPTVSCGNPNGGLVLTTSTGIASCDVVFGPRTGSGTFNATVGYTHSAGPFRFFVTPGAAASVQIVQGNNQTGNPGKTLPLALMVHVTDSGGNSVTGAAVTWKVLTANAVTLSQESSSTDYNGNASAIATLGNIAGPAQVQVTVGSVSATFNLTVVIPSAGIQKVSGDQQTAQINTAFAKPLVVKVVDSSGNGVAGAQVNFQVTSGVATLGSSSAITDSTGQASTTVTAGATAGTITVSATSSTFSVSFTLTAQPKGPANITIVNGASFNPNTGISPGAIATINGTGILPGVTGLLSAANSQGQLPTTFSGVTITFDGTPAPIYYVLDTNGADQVTVQVPFEVQPGSSVSMTVNVANNGSTTVMVPVKPLAPGVFTSVYGGKTYAAAVRPDGSPVSPTNPAQRGENIQFYVTGLGQATPTIATGALGVPNQAITSSMVVGLNNGGVPLISAVYAPGSIGAYIVTLQVPEDTETGPYQPVGIIAADTSGKLYFAQPTYIPIQ